MTEATSRDPLTVTAAEMIRDANQRADLSEARAKWLLDDLKRANERIETLMDEIHGLGKTADQSRRDTAERVVDYLWRQISSAAHDDEYPPDMKQRCVDWLAWRLTCEAKRQP